MRTFANFLFIVAGVIGGLTVWKVTRPDGPPLCYTDDQCFEVIADWQCKHMVDRKDGNTAIRSRGHAFPVSTATGVVDWNFVVTCDNLVGATL